MLNLDFSQINRLYVNSSKHIPCFFSPDNSATIEFAENKQKQFTLDIMSHSTKWPKQFPSEWDTKTIHNFSRNSVRNCTGISSSECQQRSTTFPKVNIPQKQTIALRSEILYSLDKWASHNSTRFRLYGLNEGANSVVFKHELNYRNAAQLLDQEQKFPVRPLSKARREIDRSRPMNTYGQGDENNHLKNKLDNERHSTTKRHSQIYPSIDGQVLTKTARKRFFSISHKNEEIYRNPEISQHKSITRNSGVVFQKGKHIPSMNSRTDKTNLGRDLTDRDIGIVRGIGISRSAGISSGIGISRSAGILRGNGINRTGGSNRGIGMIRNVGGTARGIGINRNVGGTARGFGMNRGMGTGPESAQVPATRREDVSASASQHRPPKRDIARSNDQLGYGGVHIVSFSFMHIEKSLRNLIKSIRY